MDLFEILHFNFSFKGLRLKKVILYEMGDPLRSIQWYVFQRSKLVLFSKNCKNQKICSKSDCSSWNGAMQKYFSFFVKIRSKFKNERKLKYQKPRFFNYLKNSKIPLPENAKLRIANCSWTRCISLPLHPLVNIRLPFKKAPLPLIAVNISFL